MASPKKTTARPSTVINVNAAPAAVVPGNSVDRHGDTVPAKQSSDSEPTAKAGSVEDAQKPVVYEQPVYISKGVRASPLAATAMARFDRSERQRTQLSEHYVFRSNVIARRGYI